MSASPVVLHLLREDHQEHVGGDLVQLAATVDGLRAAGVDAVAAVAGEGPARVDVVHAYNLQRPAALLRDLRTARRRWPGAPIVLSPVWWPVGVRPMVRTRDREFVLRAVKTGIKGTAWWPYLRHVLRRADLVLPNSEAEVAALRRTFRIAATAASRQRWAVVPNGIHLERWPFGRAPAADRDAVLTELGLDPSTPTLAACVARVEPVKNQLAIVEALDRLPSTSLALIGPEGTDRYTAAVRVAAAADGRRGRVAFAGRRSPDEVARLLRAVDVHVLASYRETPGLATLEAAASGCGVVVTADGSAPEYLGDTAHVADPVDPASIAAAIRAAAADPRQPAARHRVERYDWSVAVAALVDAYGRLPAWPSTTRE